MEEEDKSTLSNPLKTKAKHVDWNVIVDFEKHILSATATYQIEILSNDADSIQLDTRGLDIQSITLDGAVVDYDLDDEVPGKLHLGQKLSIFLPGDGEADKSSSTEKVVKLVIKYTTSPDPEKCSAAQWLTPAQTSGKKHPYLFTQCQAIHARSILPCYDCPMVKMTYNASITVPAWSTAVMSALPVESQGVGNDTVTEEFDGMHTFEFKQPVPIPAYLLALAVGELSSHDLSPRCRVWCEPSILAAAAKEFHQTETFLQTAEEITSMPYVWQRYDLLILPGSFPYGGMENPCLTFVTPTLLSGDGSLVCVVAHEIAHSWTGNLITNRTWGHFWLNEGWTTWLQRRIMNKVEGVSADMDLDAIGGAIHLEQDVELLDKEMTSLVLKLGDDDPDESYSSVPYEKGFHLIYAIERMVGPDTFLELVEAYMKKFAYGTVTSEEFKEFCISFWKDTNAVAYMKVKEFPWDKWLYEYGMPPLPKFNKTLAEEAELLAAAWVDFDAKEADAPNMDISGWTSAQKVCFLDAMLTMIQDDSSSSSVKKLQISTLKMMEEIYGFHQSQNSEILFRFCMLAVQSEHVDIYPTVVRFITSQGRMKYIRPLYRAMFASSSKARGIAVDTFIKNKDFYHPIASKMIAYDMTKNQGSILSKLKMKLISSKYSVAIGVAAVAVVTSIAIRRAKK